MSDGVVEPASDDPSEGDEEDKSDMATDAVEVSCEMVERSVDPDWILVKTEEVGMTRTVTVDDAGKDGLDELAEAYDDAAKVAGLVSETVAEDWCSDEAVNVTLASDALDTGAIGGREDVACGPGEAGA